jgi:predicted RNA-binding Zn ribbon-like protein
VCWHRCTNTGQSRGLRLHHNSCNLSIPRFLVTLLSSLIHLTQPQRKRTSQPGPLFLGGHLALDFLNTRMRVNGKLGDVLQRDQDVLHWLKQAGLAAPRLGRGAARMSLLDSARTLRENIRSLVEKQKAERRGDPAVLNRFLSAAQSHSRLVWNKPRSVTIEKVRRKGTPEEILAPVAEAAADLLAMADFTLVKRCEDDTCVLWFADRTKSHHRRWCSMGICGNRQKVAAYRRRLRDRAGSVSRRR